MSGRKLTLDERKRIGLGLKNKLGEKARAWKGEKAGYAAKHMWIAVHYGKASKCEMCGTGTAKRYEWSNISGLYKRERTDYRELCGSCHRRLDYGNKCKRGHDFSPENTYMRNGKHRICKICTYIRNKKYKDNKRKKL